MMITVKRTKNAGSLYARPLLWLVGVGLLCGCASYERCVARYGTSQHNMLVVHHTDTITRVLALPPDSLYLRLQLDSLGNAPSGYGTTSPSGLQAAVHADSQRVYVRVYQPPRIWHDTLVRVDTLRVPVEQVLLCEPPSRQPWIVAGLALGLLMLVIVSRRY